LVAALDPLSRGSDRSRIQILLGHTMIESTVRYLDERVSRLTTVETEAAADQIEGVSFSEPPVSACSAPGRSAQGKRLATDHRAGT
jgi:hypothetical protein